MGSYLGYGLQAGVQGFQSGFNMAQKKTEMEWQKKQKKKLEQKEAELMESSSIFNSMVATAGEDGFYSEDEMMKINTAYMALAYEVKGRVDGTYKAIQAMDQKTTEENYMWFDYLKEGIQGLDAKNTEALFSFVEPNITGEKGLQMFEALRSIETKKAGIQKTVTPMEFYGESSSETRTGIAESVAGQTPGLEGVEFKEPAPEVKAPSVAEQKYDWAIENYKAGKISFEQLSKFMGTGGETGKDLTAKQQEVELMKQYGATTEEIKNKLLETGGGTTTPTSFKTLEAIKESFKNVKTKAEYDSALQSYNSSKEAKTSDWTPPSFEGQLTDLIKKVEGAIWADYVNKDGKLKSKADAEEYNTNLQHYLRLIEEARNAGVDVSQFQNFIPYKALYYGAGNPLVIAESW